MFTVRDLIAVEDLGLSVIAVTPEGLDSPVSGAFITDLPKPGPFLYAGTVVLTSGLWTRHHGDVVSFMNALAAHKVGAVVLGLLEIEVVPDSVISLARSYQIPLLTTRNDISFSAISEVITRKLAPVNEGVFQRILDFAGDLAALPLDAPHDAPLILFRASFNVSCWVVGPSGQPWASAGDPLSTADAAVAWNHALRTRTHTGRISMSGPVGRYFWSIDAAAGVSGGLIVCDVVEDSHGDVDIAMNSLRGAMRLRMMPIEIDRSSRANRVGYLVAALEAAPADPALVALSLSLEGAEPSAATLIVSADIADGAFPPGALLTVMMEALGRTSDTGPVVLGTTLGTESIVLANGVSDDASLSIAALTKGLDDNTALFDGRAIRVGVSDPSAVPMLGDALDLARQRRGAMSGPGIQIGVDSRADRYQGLLRLVAERSRTTFAHSILGPLLDHDDQHRSDLLGTLRVHLAHASGWQTAASELHIHPNTLRYRIGRVEELLGRDLSHAQDRTDLEVALVCLDLAGEVWSAGRH